MQLVANAVSAIENRSTVETCYSVNACNEPTKSLEVPRSEHEAYNNFCSLYAHNVNVYNVIFAITDKSRAPWSLKAFAHVFEPVVMALMLV